MQIKIQTLQYYRKKIKWLVLFTQLPKMPKMIISLNSKSDGQIVKVMDKERKNEN